MSPRAPRVTAKQILAVLERHGFVFARANGSHQIYKNSSGKRVTVPVHAAKTLHPKVLRSILNDAELSIEALIEELK